MFCINALFHIINSRPCPALPQKICIYIYIIYTNINTQMCSVYSCSDTKRERESIKLYMRVYMCLYIHSYASRLLLKHTLKNSVALVAQKSFEKRQCGKQSQGYPRLPTDVHFLVGICLLIRLEILNFIWEKILLLINLRVFFLQRGFIRFCNQIQG